MSIAGACISTSEIERFTPVLEREHDRASAWLAIEASKAVASTRECRAKDRGALVHDTEATARALPGHLRRGDPRVRLDAPRQAGARTLAISFDVRRGSLHVRRVKETAAAELQEILESATDTGSIASLGSAITRLAPPGSYFRTVLRQLQPQLWDVRSMTRHDAFTQLKEAVEALRLDYIRGSVTFEQLVHAEVFSDFLGAAEHQLEAGYNTPAAVLVGVTLEVHLQKLASLHNVSLHDANGRKKPASLLNSNLRKGHVYAETQRAIVESWTKIRNDAAHGAREPTADQVRGMLSGVREFVVRYPA